MGATHRGRTREATVQAVYACEFAHIDEPKAREAQYHEVLSDPTLRDAEGRLIDDLDLDFAGKLFAELYSRYETSKTAILLAAPAYPWDRISALDRAILLSGIAEMETMSNDIPSAVSINEYTEIAKQYGGDSSRRFVNGVLSTLYKKHQELTKDHA